MAWSKEARQKSIESRRRTGKFGNQFTTGRQSKHKPETIEKISKTMDTDEQRQRFGKVHELNRQRYMEEYRNSDAPELFVGFFDDGQSDDF